MARQVEKIKRFKKIQIKDHEHIIKIHDDCTKCGVCVIECPTEAISESEEKMQVDNAKCILCKWCIQVCPIEQISTTEMAYNNFMARLKKKYWYSAEFKES